jgi:hypothetical protein
MDDQPGLTFYHGTIRLFLDDILKQGLKYGEGWHGYDGVFLEKSLGDAFYFANQKRETMEQSDEAEEAGESSLDPVVIIVNLPASESKFLAPDLNLDEFDPGIAKDEFSLPLGTRWNDEKVHAVVYNKCRKENKTWVKWYEKHGNKDIDMETCEPTAIDPKYLDKTRVYRNPEWGVFEFEPIPPPRASRGNARRNFD